MVSLLPIVAPILLIFIKAIIGIIPSLSAAEGPVASFLISCFNFVGTPILALSISTLLAVYLLVPYLDRHETSTRLEEGLQSAGIILMVTGAGGALGAVVRDSSIGTQLAAQIVEPTLIAHHDPVRYCYVDSVYSRIGNSSVCNVCFHLCSNTRTNSRCEHALCRTSCCGRRLFLQLLQRQFVLGRKPDDGNYRCKTANGRLVGLYYHCLGDRWN